MKFRRTPQFGEDFRRLEDEERAHVLAAFQDVAKALQGNVELYRHFRIKKMQGWDGMWEGHVKGDALCFTFHYEKTPGGEKICFFRRVGSHTIYKSP